MCSPEAPGAWYRTSAVSPVVISRRSAESSTGGTAGVTGHGDPTTSTPGTPPSPTILLSIGVAGPPS